MVIILFSTFYFYLDILLTNLIITLTINHFIIIFHFIIFIINYPNFLVVILLNFINYEYFIDFLDQFIVILLIFFIIMYLYEFQINFNVIYYSFTS